MSLRSRIEPADVFAFTEALSRDDQRSSHQRRELDAKYAACGASASDGRLETLVRWLEVAEADDASIGRFREQFAQTAAWTSGILFVAGSVTGLLAAWAALFFDGSGRINVISVLGLLVLLPGLLLIPFVLAALPAHWTARIPGIGLATQLFRFLNPGRVALWLTRKLPGRWADEGLSFTGKVRAEGVLYRRILKWMVLRWSQFFALGFQVAALGACVGLVVFSDLAFGWSTTLTSGERESDARRMHQVVTTVSAPWGWALSSAVPDLELVEYSRYFRAASSPVSDAGAARLGGWWPFVVVCLLVYGMIPRWITFTLSGLRLRTASREALLTWPGANALIGRLHRSLIISTAEDEEAVQDATESPAEAPAASPEGQLAFRVGINWASVPVEDALLANALRVSSVVHAGGNRTPEEDDQLIGSIHLEPGENLALVVKAWEPPLLECMDFLKELRQHLGEQVEIGVFPVSIDSGLGISVPALAHFEVWQRRVRQVGDPRMKVHALFGQEVKA